MTGESGLGRSGYGLMLAMVCLSACGRLGFEQAAQPSLKEPSLDGGPARDAGGPQNPTPELDGGTDAATGPQEVDAGTDSGMDGGMDSGGPDGGPADAGTGDEDAGAEDAGPAPPDDSCMRIGALPTAPIIDGVLEAGLTLKLVTPVEWTVVDPIPAGHQTHLAVAWRPNGLYVFVDVTDSSRLPADVIDPTWCGDGVEMYFDADGTYAAPPAYDLPGTGQFIVSAPVDDATESTRAEVYNTMGLQGVWTSTEFVSHPRPGGYTVEALLEGPDVGVAPLTLSAGMTIGYNISINVSHETMISTACGWRMGQYFLRVGEPGPLFPYVDVTGFCSPILD